MSATAVAGSKRQQSGPSEGGDRKPDQGGDNEGGAMLTFTEGAQRITRRTSYDETLTLQSGQRQFRSLSVPTVGYLRHIVLKVVASGGDGASVSAVAQEDAPWSVIREIIFRDVNGAPLATVSGYQLYLANKYLAYAWAADPRAHPAFSDVDTDGNFTFFLRIPAEVIMRDAYGALANQNASSPYKVELALAPASDVYSTNPENAGGEALPDVRIQAWLEAWSQPPAQDPLTGLPVKRVPKDLDTTQVISREIIDDVSSGEQTIDLTHVGNWHRCLMFILETSAGARTTSDYPDELTLWVDDRQRYVLERDYWRGLMVEQYDYAGADEAEDGLDTGVLVLPFHDDLDGHPGSERRSAYLLTTPATSLRITGNFGASADRLTVLYNQILPPEKAPEGRVSGGGS